MAVFQLPLLGDSTTHYAQRTQLDGIDYIFTFKFNERRALWTMDIIGPAEEQVIGGQVIYVGTNFLRRSQAISKPKGLLTALSSNGDVSAPIRGDLGTRISIYYFDAAELGLT